MLAGIFHDGSGLGNQLHRYVMTRVLALEKGYQFGMINPEKFKGHGFMQLNMGVPVSGLLHEYHEAKTLQENNDVRDYDDKIWDVEDFTLIDGEFQGERYYQKHLDKIRDWLETEPLEMDDNVCIIGFRGGEYQYIEDLFLKGEYWTQAIQKMRNKYPKIQFEVRTDDPATAAVFFPHFPIYHEMTMDWRKIRYAKHLIIANSSFFILPCLLNEDVKEIIAPKYWAGHNKGYWQLRQNKYDKFTYI